MAIGAPLAWPARLRKLARQGITLWEADLDEAAPVAPRFATPADLASARRISCSRERAHWLAGRLLQREVLAWTGNGTPDAPLRHSSSRRGAQWLLALGPCALGVELDLGESGCADTQVRRLLSLRELRIWQRRQLPGRERMYSAVRMAKEAVTKAVGRQQALPPTAIELPPLVRNWRRLPPSAAPRTWWLRQLRGSAGHHAALCAGEPLPMLARISLRAGDVARAD